MQNAQRLTSACVPEFKIFYTYVSQAATSRVPDADVAKVLSGLAALPGGKPSEQVSGMN